VRSWDLSRLTELTAGDVQGALGVLASRLSTRTVQIAHNVLVRAIRQAERDDLVGRNVAALVKSPKGQLGGRPSKSLTLEQAVSLMAAARGTRLEAYVTLSLLTGLRTEEVWALRWDHVVARVGSQWEPVSEAAFDHKRLAVFVWRADRAGGDTKTPKSQIVPALTRGRRGHGRDFRLTRMAKTRALRDEPPGPDQPVLRGILGDTGLDPADLRQADSGFVYFRQTSAQDAARRGPLVKRFRGRPDD
jgi:integrase